MKYLGHIVSADGITWSSKDWGCHQLTTAYWPENPEILFGLLSELPEFHSQLHCQATERADQRLCPNPKEQETKILLRATWESQSPLATDGTSTDVFHQIIYCLTHSPVLAFADPDWPYILHVDASLKGAGTVLHHKYPEGLRPVAFASRKLSQYEKRYHIHQLEILSV